MDKVGQGQTPASPYQALDSQKRQIRILELLPDKPGSDLVGKIHISSLLATPILTLQENLIRLKDGRGVLEQEDATSSEIQTYANHTIWVWSDCIAQMRTFLEDWVKKGSPDDENTLVQMRMLLGILRSIIRWTQVVASFVERNPLQFETRFRTETLQISSQITESLSFIDRLRQRFLPHDLLIPDLNDPFDALQAANYTGIGVLANLNFEPVSYCWADPTPSTFITLDGITIGTPRSAFQALEAFRLLNESRMLWLDAVCIDQANDDEKADQIPLMGDIYRSGRRTLAWLSPDTIETVGRLSAEQAMLFCKVLGHLLAQRDTRAELVKRYSSFRLEDKSLIELKSLDTYTEEEALIIREMMIVSIIFESRLFTRLWIYQEIFNSRNLTCHVGDVSIEWPIMKLIIDFMNDSRPYDRVHKAYRVQKDKTALSAMGELRLRLDMHAKQVGVVVQTLTLSQLAHISRNLGTSDPRDKIWALLSMTSWARDSKPLPQTLRPDYAMPVIDCICNATKAMIEENGDLIVLEQSSTTFGPSHDKDGDESAWPSWAPRWDKFENGDFIDPSIVVNENSAITKHSELDKYLLTSHSSPRVLPLRGARIDFIEQIIRLDEGVVDYRLDGLFEDVWERLKARIQQRFEQTINFPSKRWITNLLLGYAPDEDRINIFGHNSASDSLMVALLYQRTCFKTSKGFVGITKALTRPSHQVVMLCGARWPYLLEPKDGKFKFLGSCHFWHDGPDQNLVYQREASEGKTVFELT